MPTIFGGFVFNILGYIIALLSLAIASASASIVIVDNTSPQVIYSPTPCYEDAPTACSTEWILVESLQAFNGSVTSTNGPLPDPSNVSVSILPRVTLNFFGSSISFFPGPNSTANASITIDDQPSLIIDTSRQSYQVTQLGVQNSHTLVIEYVENDNSMWMYSGVLEVDYFLVVQDEEVLSTSSSTTSLAPTSSISSPSLSQTSQPTADSLAIEGSRNRPSVGTIIAIAISASALFLAALSAWVLGAKHRRRRMAIQRENAILTNMKMPSEGDDIGGNRILQCVRREVGGHD